MFRCSLYTLRKSSKIALLAARVRNHVGFILIHISLITFILGYIIKYDLILIFIIYIYIYIYLSIYIDIYTHTHTYIYIYIYIKKESARIVRCSASMKPALTLFNPNKVGAFFESFEKIARELHCSLSLLLFTTFF